MNYKDRQIRTLTDRVTELEAEAAAEVQTTCSRQWKLGTPVPPCVIELRRRTVGTVADAKVERGRRIALDLEIRTVYDQFALEGDELRSTVAALESKLTNGTALVHACAATERVSARLVAWAGEPDQSGKDDNPNE